MHSGPTRFGGMIFAILLFLVTLVTVFLNSSGAFEGRVNTVHTNEYRPPSIAFYEIVGSNRNFTNDYRGKLWQWQLKNFRWPYSFHYISNGPLSLEGIDCVVPTEVVRHYPDRKLCYRSMESMKHFIQFHPDTRWFMRTIEDTLVSLTGVRDLVSNLENRGDPMSQILMAYGLHLNGKDTYYPHGGSGWLLSNFAVRAFINRSSDYEYYCNRTADDLAMAFLIKSSGIDLFDWVSPMYIIKWPRMPRNYQKKKFSWQSVPTCPKDGYELMINGSKIKIGPLRSSAAIHFHGVRLNESWRQFSSIPPNIGVYWPVRRTILPTFCRVYNITGR